MGGSSSKQTATVVPVDLDGDGKISKAEMQQATEMSALRKSALQTVVTKKLIFDAHCHYTTYMQETEGFEALSKAMEKNGVGYAAVTPTAFKKTWVGDPTGKPPVHHLYDDGDLYYYTSCDGNLYRHLDFYKKKAGLAAISKFSMLACGVNLGDYSSGEMAAEIVANYPMMAGFGEIVLQSDDINNVTIKGGNWTYTEPSVKKIIALCAKKEMPFVFYSDARSATTKPYRNDFEYIDEIEMVCGAAAPMSVKCLWCGCGVFARGQWKEPSYAAVLKNLISKYPNLYISFTPELVAGMYSGITREDALEIAEALPGRVVLGTTVRGIFMADPPKEFGEMSYTTQIGHLSKFADQIQTRAGAAAAAFLRYRTACCVYGLATPEDSAASEPLKEIAARGATLKALLKKDQSVNSEARSQAAFIASLAYGGSGGSTNAVCPPSVSEKKWDTIDCHLHLLDFLQKSSGTTAALKAMDGCDCKKAVLFGMPCCKKWCFYRPEQPLYYQDDNGPCYVYAYADQMVADAWLALVDEERARFAPSFASFDPTDLAALAHVKRMYYKYPKMWRAIGEVMCRHDDLTTMLLGKEIPRVNHPALDFIYKFAIEVDLPVLVHHNADRVGDNDNSFEYLDEVKDVLRKYPKLKFTWVHAGVSRRCSEPSHHKMIEQMCDEFDNLKVDISWVVWEDVICDEKGVIKQGWVDTIQKHFTKFYVGSDNVAQFFPLTDSTTNLLAGNITKYYQLYDKLTEEAGNMVSYGNAQRDYFEKWTVPTGTEPGAYFRMPSYYDTECLNPKLGEFIKGASDLDDDGKY